MSSRSPSLPYAVLIVEDELAIAENLALRLDAEGWSTDLAREARSALQHLEHNVYDLVLLDIGLPGMDGYRLLEQMRATHQLATPVLILTARAGLENTLRGFDHGADDYLTKPFALEEVVARARSLIRRFRQLSDTTFVLVHGPLRYAVADQHITLDGQTIHLPLKGMQILELLMRYAGRVVTRARLEAHLWQGEPPSDEALRSQMHLLRRSLAAHGYDGIETVHRLGWRLTDPAA